jgi:hypothetical protein
MGSSGGTQSLANSNIFTSLTTFRITLILKFIKINRDVQTNLNIYINNKKNT